MAVAAARLAVVLAVASALALASASGAAQTGAPQTGAPQAEAAGALRVAVAQAPPFAERGADGTWSGLAVELATDVGQALGRPVRVVGVSGDTPGGDGGASLLAAVASGRADLAVVAATTRAEAQADLAGAFYTARLGVARPPGSRVADVAGRLFSSTFLWIAAGLSVMLLVVGTIIWALERSDDSDDFREGAPGVWDGFWWAGVTMTTIGYGDTVPTTVGGRAVALLWMLVSMAVTAALTAALVSALGLEDGGDVRIPDDLRGDRVGVVEGSPAARLLAEAGLDARPFPDVEAGLAAVEADSLDAFAASAPLLRAARSSESSVRVRTTGVDLDRWAFAVATGSALREPVARAVLDRVQSPDWPETVRRYVSSD